MLRVQGYLMKNSKDGMLSYLLFNTKFELTEKKKTKKMPLWKRVIYYFISFIGTSPRAWKLTDKLIDSSFFEFTELVDFTSQYSEVSLIQSSYWGKQGRMLSWNSRKYKWKNIFIPYTTDQLHTNRYLM